MKIEPIYKGTSVLLGICLITLVGYNVGVSKGEETETSKDEIPDLWDLTKPKVESIELEYWKSEYFEPEHVFTVYVYMTNVLSYPVPILGMVRGYEYSGQVSEIQPVHHPIWFLNTTEGWQFHVANEQMGWGVPPTSYNVRVPSNVHSLLPNKTVSLRLVFKHYSIHTYTEETIYYEAYIESQHTIVKGVCEVPNITP